MKSLYRPLLILIVTIFAGCGSPPTATLEATASATDPPPPTATVTSSPTATITPTITSTPTATPTSGPGLAELIGTPDALVREVKLDEAMAAYQELAELYPNNAEPRLGQAALARRDGNLEITRFYLEAALEADPNSLEALRQFALLLDELRDDGTLILIYDQMIVIEPDNVDLLAARAMAQARVGDAARAIESAEFLQARDPYRAYIWANITAAASSAREYEAAIEMASAGIGLNPDAPDLYLMRGLAYLSLDDPAMALSDFEQVIALDDIDYTAYLWRGRTHVLLGDTESAVPDLQRAGELGVLSGVTGVNLGYEAMGEAAAAMATFDEQGAFEYMATQVFQYGSRDPFLLGYARIDLQRGNPTLALSRLRGLVEDGYLPALYWRAVVYIEEEETDLAIGDFQAYLMIRGSGPEAESARRLLESLGGEELSGDKDS